MLKGLPSSPELSKLPIQGAKSNGGESAPDLFLECLSVIAGHYGLSADRTVLTAGLPLEQDRLTFPLAERAAMRLGMRTKLGNAKLRNLVPLDVPAILIRKTGAPVVLLGGNATNGYSVFFPETQSTRKVQAQALEADYSGACLRLKPGYGMPEDTGAAISLGPERKSWFWGVANLYWRSYSIVILATVVINLVALIMPLFTMHVYDRVIPNKAMTTLWVFVVGLAVAFIFDLLLKLARSSVLDRVGRKIDIQLASILFEKILNTRLSERPATAGVLANRFNEYEAIREFFSSSTVMLFVDVSFFALFAAVIYLIGGWVVVIPIAALLIVVVLGCVLQARLARVIRNAQQEAALRHSVLVESIASIETIKSLRAEGHVLRRWEGFARAAAESSEQMKHLSAINLNVTGFIQQLVAVLLIVAGVYQFAEGNMTMGAIIATVLLSNRLVAPLAQIAMSFTRARYVALAFKNLNEIMAKPDELVSNAGFVNRRIERGLIEFRGVKFSYPGATAIILEGVNVVIRPGERVGVIGRIGSGKTTLGRLLTGLYQPTEGEILVDGVDLRQYHPHEVRRSIGLIVQDADLFYGTIRENIVMARPTASDDEIVSASKLSGVDRIVASNPQGYEMNVGERGNRLSSGQRQCVALARAFLTDPRVLFLDEPSSSMDMQTERQFLASLKEGIRTDQTLIIATHRNTMLKICDRLLVVDGGRIVRDGPRDAVIADLSRERDVRLATRGPE